MILYTLTAYCSGCGHDLAESDAEDAQALAEGLTHRAETLYHLHLTESRCGSSP